MARAKKPSRYAHYLETVKFAIRLALLVFTPVIVGRLMELDGTAKTIVENVLPLVLPVMDKWIHLDPRIKAKGIIPF